MTLAPLLRIISMSTASMSLSSPHALASQLPGVLVLSVEQSLFATEDCAHYAADYMQSSTNVFLTFTDAATKIQCPMPILLYLIPAFHRHAVSLSLIACTIMDSIFIYLSSFSVVSSRQSAYVAIRYGCKVFYSGVYFGDLFYGFYYFLSLLWGIIGPMIKAM